MANGFGRPQFPGANGTTEISQPRQWLVAEQYLSVPKGTVERRMIPASFQDARCKGCLTSHIVAG
jgi:hypothetical protein